MTSRIQWEVPEISPEHKVAFYGQSDKSAIFDLVMRLALHALVFGAMVITVLGQSFALFGLLILVNGVLVSFLGWAGAGHEYFHGSAFKNKRINRFLFRLFSCVTWNNWGWFEVSHQLHHKYTLHTSDPESPKGEGRMSLFRLFWLISVDAPTLLRRLRILALNVIGVVPSTSESLKSVLATKPNFIRKIRIGAAVVFFYQSLTILILLQFSPLLAVANAFAPFIFTIVNKVVEVNQHYGMRYHAQDFRQNSRTIRFNRFIEFLYSNMNFHAEHHMFPGVPYYKLPSLNAYLVKLGIVEIPKKGFLGATKTLMNSNLDIKQSKDCLNCFAKCPISS